MVEPKVDVNGCVLEASFRAMKFQSPRGKVILRSLSLFSFLTQVPYFRLHRTVISYRPVIFFFLRQRVDNLEKPEHR